MIGFLPRTQNAGEIHPVTQNIDEIYNLTSNTVKRMCDNIIDQKYTFNSKDVLYCTIKIMLDVMLVTTLLKYFTNTNVSVFSTFLLTILYLTNSAYLDISTLNKSRLIGATVTVTENKWQKNIRMWIGHLSAVNLLTYFVFDNHSYDFSVHLMCCSYLVAMCYMQHQKVYMVIKTCLYVLTGVYIVLFLLSSYLLFLHTHEGTLINRIFSEIKRLTEREISLGLMRH